MLGWQIQIYPQRLVGQSRREIDVGTLASWDVGLGGTDWLNTLVKSGLAVSLGGDGYPSRYVITSNVLLGIRKDGIPKPNGPMVVGDDYVQQSGWIGCAKIDWKKVEALAPAELLTVEAWDQS